jgi:ribosomal 50S subunit-associated protein YjgA (DUF615 family)
MMQRFACLFARPAALSQQLTASDDPSKSQIKRDLHALQALAEQMLSPAARRIGTAGPGRGHLGGHRRDRAHQGPRAMRRHIKRMANCLARENTEPLQTLLAARDQKARQAAARGTTSSSAGGRGSSTRATPR